MGCHFANFRLSCFSRNKMMTKPPILRILSTSLLGPVHSMLFLNIYNQLKLIITDGCRFVNYCEHTSGDQLALRVLTPCSNMMSCPGLEKPRFLEKVFRFLGFFRLSNVFLRFWGFFRFKCPNKPGHKISTQEEHPIHNSLSFRAFSVKYNKTHK